MVTKGRKAYFKLLLWTKIPMFLFSPLKQKVKLRDVPWKNTLTSHTLYWRFYDASGFKSTTNDPFLHE